MGKKRIVIKEQKGENMKGKLFKVLSATALITMLAVPTMANASEKQEKGFKDSDTEGIYTAEKKGASVIVSQNGDQIFKTKGSQQIGKLKDLFVLHERSPLVNPLIVVEHPKNGLMVFSDLWMKFDDGTYSQNTVDAYDSGRIFYTPQEKIVSKTGHHYAVQDGNEVVVYSLNNYDDLNSGFHVSYRTEGTLRGLIIHECCPYAVVKTKDGQMVAYGFGHSPEQEGQGPGILAHIDLQ